MERELPIYEIMGTSFEVDVRNGELRQKGKPKNSIPFSEMDYEKTHYRLSYDTRLKNLSESVYAKTAHWVEIPLRKELDPEGMALRNNISLDDVKRTSEFKLFNDPGLIAIRRLGKQPIIEIEGHPFYIDIYHLCLRPKDDFSTTIELSMLDENSKGDGYAFLYNPAKHSVVEFDPEMVELPKNVVFIEIPGERIMDPVGYGMFNGYGEEFMESFLMKYPVQKGLKATKIPMEDTLLPELVKENRARKNLPVVNDPQEKKEQRGRKR